MHFIDFKISPLTRSKTASIKLKEEKRNNKNQSLPLLTTPCCSHFDEEHPIVVSIDQLESHRQSTGPFSSIIRHAFQLCFGPCPPILLNFIGSKTCHMVKSRQYTSTSQTYLHNFISKLRW